MVAPRIEITTEKTLEQLREHLEISTSSVNQKQAIISMGEMLALTKEKMDMRQIEAWGLKNNFDLEDIRHAKTWLFFREYLLPTYKEMGSEGKLIYEWSTTRLI
jgi:hypothetical protein